MIVKCISNTVPKGEKNLSKKGAIRLVVGCDYTVIKENKSTYALGTSSGGTYNFPKSMFKLI